MIIISCYLPEEEGWEKIVYGWPQRAKSRGGGGNASCRGGNSGSKGEELGRVK